MASLISYPAVYPNVGPGDYLFSEKNVHHVDAYRTKVELLQEATQ